MKFKGTAALFIVLVVLGAFVYFTEYRGKEERQKQQESKKKAVQVEQKDITEISLIFPDRTISGVKKGEKQWQITSPAGLEADSDEWDQLAANFARVVRAESVAENTQDLTPFSLKDPAVHSSFQFARAASLPDPPVDAKTAGLDPPAMRITAHDGKAKADRTLLIGKTSENDKYYAKDASRDTVFIIEKEIPDKARRPVFDWRDKTITKLDRDKIEQIEVLRGAEKSSIKKDGSDWKLPDGRKLQWDKVSAMLNTLEFEKAKDIIDMPKVLSTYGLDKPRLEIVFRQGSNDLARIAFGSESKSPEGIYAKTSDGPAVKVITKSIFDNFNVKVEDLVETPPAPPPAPEKPPAK